MPTTNGFTSGNWTIGQNSSNMVEGVTVASGTHDSTYDLMFMYGGSRYYYHLNNFDSIAVANRYQRISSSMQYVSFTGSHINTFTNKDYCDDKYKGLIFSVISKNKKFITFDGKLEILISEALPLLELCNIDKCKRVFGVFSTNDISTQIFEQIRINKQYDNFTNETRAVLNSLGEGGIWICNKNGTFEAGDMITSSTVPGYGILQDDDLHHSYTVGKITCDCEFSLVKEKLQKLVCSIDTSDNRTIILSEDGNIQYEDDLDLSGNQIYEYPYDTRFLLPDGTILDSEDEYHSRKANGEEVFIACFVGCVYYCG